MQEVYIIDRCDNFYEVRDAASGQVIPCMVRLVDRSAAHEFAAKRGLTVVDRK